MDTLIIITVGIIDIATTVVITTVGAVGSIVL